MKKIYVPLSKRQKMILGYLLFEHSDDKIENKNGKLTFIVDAKHYEFRNGKERIELIIELLSRQMRMDISFDVRYKVANEYMMKFAVIQTNVPFYKFEKEYSKLTFGDLKTDMEFEEAS